MRLGWLRVIAGLVGSERRSSESLRTGLVEAAEQSTRWFEEAGITEQPRGNVPPTRADRLARMGVTYGIYDAQRSSLTDLGHVLRIVAPWSPGAPESPFRWEGEARWIGFYTVVQAAGDVLLPLIRGWSPEEMTTRETAAQFGRILSNLARQAPPDERGFLRSQITAVRHQTVYAYLEPLRDLNYVERITIVGGRQGYRLAKRGQQLREALQSMPGSTDEIIRNGLSRVFLQGEGMTELHPADAAALLPVLARIPPELTVLRPEEVPLEPVVLLAQARLLREDPGAWLDKARVLALLRAVKERSGGRLYLKQGLSVHELNVTWEPSLLMESGVWDVAIDVQDERGSGAFDAEVSENATRSLEAKPESSTTQSLTTAPNITPLRGGMEITAVDRAAGQEATPETPTDTVADVSKNTTHSIETKPGPSATQSPTTAANVTPSRGGVEITAVDRAAGQEATPEAPTDTVAEVSEDTTHSLNAKPESSETQSPTTAPSVTPSQEGVESRSDDLAAGQEATPETPTDAVAEAPPSSSRPGDPTALLDASLPGSLRLWLQYVDALLAPPGPSAVDVFRWGGLMAALSRLHVLVNDLPDNRLREKREPFEDRILSFGRRSDGKQNDGKQNDGKQNDGKQNDGKQNDGKQNDGKRNDGNRKNEPLCTRPLRCMPECLRESNDDWLIIRALEIWRSPEERRFVRTVVERALRLAPAAVARLRQRIMRYLQTPGSDPDWTNWPTIRDATRAVVHDALVAGSWSGDELRARLHHSLHCQPVIEAALRWLQLLSEERKECEYVQRRTFLVEDEERMQLEKLVELARQEGLPAGLDARGPLAPQGDIGGPEGVAQGTMRRNYEFVAKVDARSPYEARQLGRARVHTLLVAHYAQYAAAGVDAPLDLPEVPPFEAVNNGALEIDQDGLVAGLLVGAAPRERAQPVRLQDVFAQAAWARRPTPDARQRLLRARRGLILSHDPDRRPEERLALAWAAVEQLIAAGEEAKGDTIIALSSAASLIQERRWLRRIHHQARVGLWMTAILSPDPALAPFIDVWLRDEAEEVRRVAALALSARQAYIARAARTGLPPYWTDQEALICLLDHRPSLLKLRDVIMAWAPLASNALQEFVQVTGDGLKPGSASKPPAPLGDGSAFARQFRELYEDISSFVAHVYELRNRFMHSGEGFDLAREPATHETLERFLALAAPVLGAVESRLDTAASLEQIWLQAQDLAQDLAWLHRSPHPPTFERLWEIISF